VFRVPQPGARVRTIVVCLAALLAVISLSSACAGSGDQSGVTGRAVAPGVARDGTVGGTGAALAPGTWGGEHLRLMVTASGADLEFDCAHATIDQPFLLDADGHFDLRGRYTAEHGGPVRDGEILPSRDVRYTGAVSGNTMSLAITFTDDGTQQGAYSLTLGQSGRVLKCL
jgi:hypothetical protein